MQIAQLPGRDEPDENGEVNFPFLFKLLNKLGYDGWVACEYVPRGKRGTVFFHLPPCVCRMVCEWCVHVGVHCVSLCMPVCVCACLFVSMYAYMCVYVYVCVCVCVCLSVCLSVCVWFFSCVTLQVEQKMA